jgi:hypothetical protein
MIIVRDVLLVITLLALCGGCDRSPAPSAKSESADAVSSETTSEPKVTQVTCEEGDIECDERMYQLEETLFAYEAIMGKRLHPEARSCWQTDIAAFRTEVDACTDYACKEEALLRRISSLHDMQPTEQRAALALPQVPALIAVLPPSVEESEIGSEVNAALEVQGSLIHATTDPEHMGIAVQEDGKDHVFIFDMDMGSDHGQDEVLGLVGTSPTTQVLVRGVAQVAPTGVSNLDPAHCRWVYQLP